MSQLKTLLEQNWTGRTLHETVECSGKRFKIVTGQENGGGENRVYILGDNGWNRFINKGDIPFKPSVDSSYVSDEPKRKVWAEELNAAYKVAISKVF